MREPRYAFAPPSVVGVPVAGSDLLFPVRRVYCVGRNYAAHIREMGGNDRDPPFFFQKPTDSIVLNGEDIAYPPFTNDFQYEVELVLAIGASGADVDERRGLALIFGLAVGIDLTRRDVQVEARKAGRPWEVGKSFDRSAPISAIHPLQGALPASAGIGLRVNGTERQTGDIAEMIWRPAEIVSTLSRQYRLEPGDLIFTGTPAGVGPVEPGDLLEASVAGVDTLTIRIVDRSI